MSHLGSFCVFIVMLMLLSEAKPKPTDSLSSNNLNKNITPTRYYNNYYGNYYDRQDENALERKTPYPRSPSSSTGIWRRISEDISRIISSIRNAARGLRDIDRQAGGALGVLQAAGAIGTVGAGLALQPGSAINTFLTEAVDTILDRTTTHAPDSHDSDHSSGSSYKK